MNAEPPMEQPGFWDNVARYETLVHDFTCAYARRAIAEADLPRGSRVLDIATGVGALAFAAAEAGLDVLATDFSAAMVARVAARGMAGLKTGQMDGQALDLPDSSFDAAFSMFGIMLFPDWRAGLSEMARVIRPGGLGIVGTWAHEAGAAANLYLALLCDRLFPDLAKPEPLAGMAEWREPARFSAAMVAAGFEAPRIVEVAHDYPIARTALEEPDQLFTFSPVWDGLDTAKRTLVLATIGAEWPEGETIVSVPSPALIALARRP